MIDKNMKTFGIDLGTTFSCVARLDDENKKVEVIPNSKTKLTTPSVVYVQDDQTFAVGEVALNQLKGPNAKNVISFTKRLIADDDLCQQNRFDSYPTYMGRRLNPTTVSSMILKEMTLNNDNFKVAAGNGSCGVVITFPAYFSVSAKKRTEEAGRNAGLNVIGMIEEPIAAALAYGYGRKVTNERVLVYDLGGGTFDITVVEFDSAGNARVVDKDGDPKKGGVDWDNAFGFHIWERYSRENHQDVRLTRKDFSADSLTDLGKIRKVNSFRSIAQKAKHDLTELDTVDVECDSDGNLITVTLDEFNKATSDLLDSTLTAVGALIEGKGVIDKVLMVGGSTYMRQVKAGIEDAFPQFRGKVEYCDPDRAVAKGAAIYAEMLKNPAAGSGGGLGTKPVKNIASKSYGISCYRSSDDVLHISNLINVKQKLPATGEDTFYTRSEGQEVVDIDVYESDLPNEIAKDGTNMGIAIEAGKKVSNTAQARFGRKVPKGTAVTVRFELDEAGQLRINANPQGGTPLEFVLDLVGTGKGNMI